MADGSGHIFTPAAQVIHDPDDAIVVLFAGGGGSSIAFEDALGRHPHAALNHWPIALSVHERNYPRTAYYCSGALETDPRTVLPGRKIGALWLSPDCRHFSVASGAALVSPQIRAPAWAAIPWIKLRRPTVVILENVEAFLSWGPVIVGEDGKGRPDPDRKGETFRVWVKRFRQCGYDIDWRVESVADHGGHTIRKRLKIIARCDGLPIVWPEQTHAHRKVAVSKGLRPHRPAHEIIDFSRDVHSIFMPQAEAKARGLRIKRPLEEATLRRIAAGLFRYTIDNADPFLISVTHQGDDRVHSLRGGLPTVTGAHRGEFALISPHMTAFRRGSVGRDARDSMAAATANSFIKRPGGAAPLGLVAPYLVPHYGENEGQEPRSRSVEDSYPSPVPGGRGGDLAVAWLEQASSGTRGHDLNGGLGVVTTGYQFNLMAAFMEQANTGMVGHDMREGVSSIVSKGCTQRVVAAQLSHFRSSNTEGGESDLREGLRAPTAGGQHHALLEAALEAEHDMAVPFSPYETELRAFLIKYYGSATADDLQNPLATGTSRSRFGLVVVAGRATASPISACGCWTRRRSWRPPWACRAAIAWTRWPTARPSPRPTSPSWWATWSPANGPRRSSPRTATG